MATNSVTKADLVNQIANETGLKKTEAERALSAVTGAIESALKSDQKVTLVGFGTFSVSHRAARTGINPKSQQPMQIAESWGVKFKAGKNLKESVNNAHK